MKKIFSPQNVELGFDFTIIVKAVFDFGEILSGFLFLFLSPKRISELIYMVSHKELIEDPSDFVMSHLVSLGNAFTIDAQHFASFYLLSHGLVKIAILFLLWRKKLWAYPIAIVMLVGFIAIQLQRYLVTFSPMLLFLTFLDVAMIILTVMEYRNLKKTKGNE